MKGVIVHFKNDAKDRHGDKYQHMSTCMERMSGNDKSSSRYFCDSSQQTNWILDSEETCHMTPQVSDFIPGQL